MNPNDLMAQQQALLNQAMQNAQQTQWAMMGLGVASMLIGSFVLYLFYARLRDIGDELRRIRVLYEMEQERTLRSAARPSGAAPSINPSASDAPYMPKP